VILEEVAASGGNPGARHAQMYVMGTLLRNGSSAKKQRWLPAIAAGELRLQAFADLGGRSGRSKQRPALGCKRECLLSGYS
jgi:alkylation response protein AidB-like acyl-CoA dehydrogenase